jgi:hypothetical protein
LGSVEVDDVRQVVDVDAARGDVGGHQHLHVAVLEVGRARACARPGSCCRGWPSAVMPSLLELLGEPVGAVLGAREHQHLVPACRVADAGARSSVALARRGRRG